MGRRGREESEEELIAVPLSPVTKEARLCVTLANVAVFFVGIMKYKEISLV